MDKAKGNVNMRGHTKVASIESIICAVIECNDFVSREGTVEEVVVVVAANDAVVVKSSDESSESLIVVSTVAAVNVELCRTAPSFLRCGGTLTILYSVVMLEPCKGRHLKFLYSNRRCASFFRVGIFAVAALVRDS